MSFGYHSLTRYLSHASGSPGSPPSTPAPTPKVALLFVGAVAARGRRTAMTWIRAAESGGRYQRCYIAAAGKRANRIARRLLTEVVRPLLKGVTGERGNE